MSSTDPTPPSPTPPRPAPMRDRRGRAYTPAIGARLRPLLWTILIGFALLLANGVYLASVRLAGWLQGTLQETYFSLYMLYFHVALGVLVVVPFVGFGWAHLATSWKRPNKKAIRNGLILLAVSTIVLISGFVLLRLELPLRSLSSGRLPDLNLVVRDTRVRNVGYWLHVLLPVAAIGFYLRHRLAGPPIKWHYARMWAGVVGVFIAAMAVFHTHDPRSSRVSSDPRYTFPSEAKLAGGKLISEKSLMNDEYCIKCHKDAYEGWFHSSHHFSSFNNKAYAFSVRETRKVSLERDGDTRAARWCAGCHDPVPFFSGAFDDPNYDDVNTASSQAGITCTACHAITHVNSTRGNADYTIEEPQQYPFTFSESPFLQWVNNMLVKAKPEMHKQTFLKPEVHQKAEFCSTCHKVSLPYALNHYKDFLRGQNHWDTFLLSGVAGGGARSFYYPEVAKTSCTECHMNLVPSDDFGAKDFDGKGGLKIHNHLFLGANTGLATLRGRDDIAAQHAGYLKDKKARIDLFAVRDGGSIDDELRTIRVGGAEKVPTLEPGKSYLVETVVRTLGVGHPLTQGTVDSNEIWVELIAKSDGRIIGRSGGIGEDGTVDPYSHFINVYMLDRHGNRIDRRNPQDIFVPLYNKQIPPGAGQIVHFGLTVPEGLKGPIELEAKLNYRKFDKKYLDYIFSKEGARPELPVVLMASDRVNLPVQGGAAASNEPSPIKDEWQRWNDYGIGLLLEGDVKGAQKGELKQAEEVFRKVATDYDKADGLVNLARVYLREGRNADALKALEEATRKKFAAPWVINWLAAQVSERNGELDDAIAKYKAVLETRIGERKFDFSRDFEIINALGRTLWGRYFQEEPGSAARSGLLDETIATFRRTLDVDSENVDAHYGLGIAYSELARTHDAVRPAATAADPAEVTAEALVALADRSVDAKLPLADRAEAARSLARALDRFLTSPRPEFGSRLTPMHQIVAKLAGPCASETDGPTRAALAAALAATHKTMHFLYKPDETAEGVAQKNARQNDPAANLNANAVVIHPMHRDGAPGLNPKPAEARAVEVAPPAPAADAAAVAPVPAVDTDPTHTRREARR